MSKRPMKPMYRTAAEEALILAAMAVGKYLLNPPVEPLGGWFSALDVLKTATDRVVRERKEATK